MTKVYRPERRIVGYLGVAALIAFMALTGWQEVGGEWLLFGAVTIGTVALAAVLTAAVSAWYRRQLRRLERQYPGAEFVKRVVVPYDRFTPNYLLSDPHGLTLFRGHKWPLTGVWTIAWTDIVRAESTNLDWSDMAITKPGTALHLRSGQVVGLHVPTSTFRGYGRRGADAFAQSVNNRINPTV